MKNRKVKYDKNKLKRTDHLFPKEIFIAPTNDKPFNAENIVIIEKDHYWIIEKK